MTRKYDLFWKGRLTTGNVGEIARLLRELLDGKTFILVMSYGASVPDIITNARIDHGRFKDKEAISFWKNDEEGCAGIDIAMHEEVSHFCTKLKEGVFDETRQGPFVNFQGGAVIISYRSEAGLRCHWQAVVVDEELPKKDVDGKKEMALEEFLDEIRTFDIEPKSAQEIRSEFEGGRNEVECAEYPFDLRLEATKGKARAYVLGGRERRRELDHLSGIIISDLRQE